MEYVVAAIELNTKYNFLLNYLRFQIENETYIDSKKIETIINCLEPKEEEGETNE